MPATKRVYETLKTKSSNQPITTRSMAKHSPGHPTMETGSDRSPSRRAGGIKFCVATVARVSKLV